MITSPAIDFNNLLPGQRILAIQRLTALWAFCESGLGGLLHAFRIPITGLVVGGLAVILITFIAKLSDNHYSQILQCLPVVLIIKVMASPQTPFPAYLAVSFQALMGMILFSLLRINLLSILLLAVLTMLESALQQLLTLTFFFGRSLWNAADEIMNRLAGQMGVSLANGSQWLIAVYLLVYITAGILIAFMTYRLIRNFFYRNGSCEDLPYADPGLNYPLPDLRRRKKFRFKPLIAASMMLILSASLFLFAKDAKQGWVAVIKTITWTLSAILAWYIIIAPLFSKFILSLLHKKKSLYSDAVKSSMEILPVLRRLAVMAWQKNNTYGVWKRIPRFFSTLITWSLVYSSVLVESDQNTGNK